MAWEAAAWVALGLFMLGLLGLLARRSLVFVLMSVEIMLNGAGLLLVAAGMRWGTADGQVMFLMVLCVAGTELAVGLALLLRLRGRVRDLDGDYAVLLRDQSSGVGRVGDDCD